jgi:hypothetical protein
MVLWQDTLSVYLWDRKKGIQTVVMNCGSSFLDARQSPFIINQQDDPQPKQDKYSLILASLT